MPRRRYDSLVVVVKEGVVSVLDGSDAERAISILGTAFRGESKNQSELHSEKTPGKLQSIHDD